MGGEGTGCWALITHSKLYLVLKIVQPFTKIHLSLYLMSACPRLAVIPLFFGRYSSHEGWICVSQYSLPCPKRSPSPFLPPRNCHWMLPHQYHPLMTSLWFPCNREFLQILLQLGRNINKCCACGRRLEFSQETAVRESFISNKVVLV